MVVPGHVAAQLHWTVMAAAVRVWVIECCARHDNHRSQRMHTTAHTAHVGVIMTRLQQHNLAMCVSATPVPDHLLHWMSAGCSNSKQQQRQLWPWPLQQQQQWRLSSNSTSWMQVLLVQ
jgi:hypothetical protein